MTRAEWHLVQLVGLCGGTVYAYARQPSALSTWVVRLDTGREVQLRAAAPRARVTRRVRLLLTELTLAELRQIAGGVS